MGKKSFLIYGSYGYTGNLIAKEAIAKGLKPILGGRNRGKLEDQAKALDLEYKVFDISDIELSVRILSDFVAVIHCAGPFTKTFKNMANACMKAGTHYLDITGEINVFEGLARLDTEAQASKVMLLPGIGGEVVTTDCLCKHLKNRLPDATQLTLACRVTGEEFLMGGGWSRGSLKTLFRGIHKGGVIRDKGILTKVPTAWKTRIFDLGDHRPVTCVTIGFADVSTAWYSTGIPHIEFYMYFPWVNIMIQKLTRPFSFVLGWKPIQQMIIKYLDSLPEGLPAERREKLRTLIYGEVINEAGQKAVSRLQCMEGYDFTAAAAVVIMKKVLQGLAPIGFQTPSNAYSEGLVLEIPKTTLEDE